MDTGQFPQDPPCSMQHVSPLFLLLNTPYHQPAVPVPILGTAETEPSLNALFSSVRTPCPACEVYLGLPSLNKKKATMLISLCYPLLLTEASLQGIGAFSFFLISFSILCVGIMGFEEIVQYFIIPHSIF